LSPLPSGGSGLERRGDQLGEFAEVLGGGGEEEFVFCSSRTSEAQPVELQDTLEMGEDPDRGAPDRRTRRALRAARGGCRKRPTQAPA
jgi:hypothetical protein